MSTQPSDEVSPPTTVLWRGCRFEMKLTTFPWVAFVVLAPTEGVPLWLPVVVPVAVLPPVAPVVLGVLDSVPVPVLAVVPVPAPVAVVPGLLVPL
jgi:hypothetical protein